MWWDAVLFVHIAPVHVVSQEEEFVMPQSRSPQEVWDEISRITITFSLLECDKCAIAVLEWLGQNSIPGTVLRLRTKRRSDLYIVSDRVSSDESITENGTHYGVEVFGRVFDNLSGEGMSREDWQRDFRCRSGQFVLEELDSL
jgi:Papain fold toxin 2